MTRSELIRKYRYTEDGKLHRKDNNTAVGSLTPRGYLTTMFAGTPKRLHRMIYIMHNGEIPSGMEIDHINHIRTDNRISNLRIVSSSDNMKNKSLYKNASSKTHGVRFVKNRNKWAARIKVKGKDIFLGSFDEEGAAIKARLHAERIYKFHSNHGLP